jgi:hypothetical protein
MRAYFGDALFALLPLSFLNLSAHNTRPSLTVSPQNPANIWGESILLIKNVNSCSCDTRQLQICYDMRAAILYVTVIKAKNLRFVNDMPPDPFVKCYLLPPRM